MAFYRGSILSILSQNKPNPNHAWQKEFNLGSEWYFPGFCYARCKPAPYNLYSMFYMVNISGLGLNNPKLNPDLDSTLIYALFTIMLLRDRYIYKCHICIYCIGVVRDEPYRLHQYRKQNMTANTYNIIMSEIRVYLEDQDRKVSARSYKGNSDCIKALLDVACRLLPREEFHRLYTECMEW